MSDSHIHPFEKQKKVHIKLLPLQVEAIETRSSIRRRAYTELCDVAEKIFPQVTWNDEVIEKLHAMEAVTKEAAQTAIADADERRDSKVAVPENPPAKAEREETAKPVPAATPDTKDSEGLDIEAIRARIAELRKAA
jgi:hypothetical protein